MPQVESTSMWHFTCTQLQFRTILLLPNSLTMPPRITACRLKHAVEARCIRMEEEPDSEVASSNLPGMVHAAAFSAVRYVQRGSYNIIALQRPPFRPTLSSNSNRYAERIISDSS